MNTTGAPAPGDADSIIVMENSNFIAPTSTSTLDQSSTSQDEDRGKQRSKTKQRVSIACTECRNQHLRCDAGMPVCSRCQQSNKNCIYKSLRNRPRNSRQGRGQQAGAASAVATGAPTLESALELSPIRRSPLYNVETSIYRSPGGMNMYLEDVSTSDNALLEGFYRYFYPGHPFVLPESEMARQRAGNPVSVEQLLPVMRLIGSRYVNVAQTSKYLAETDAVVENALLETGYSVQALLLYALFLEWNGEAESSVCMLQKAKHLALELGMQYQTFASEYGNGDPMLEESWRRTWWELYVVDAVFSGVRQLPSFSLWKTKISTHLPCDDATTQRPASIRKAMPRAIY